MTTKYPEIVINHATVRKRADMADFIPACAARGMRRASLWGDEIDKTGIASTKALLSDNNMTTFGFNRAGPLLATGKEERQSLLDDAKRRIDQAAEFGADHILVFSGGLPPGSKDINGAREQAEDAIAALLDHARARRMPLALEPLHPMLTGDRAVLASMSQANDICDRMGHGIGIVIDVYHVWWDERLKAEVARAGAARRILGFHVNDWLIPTRHILRDRGMMGDGVIDLAGIWKAVRDAGYAGPIEVEIFSDEWWSENPGQVLNVCVERCREIFKPDTKTP